MLYPTFKITKPIRLIELFAGYGSQALALKYLGVEFEHWKICEWAIKSIQAYKDIHFPNGYHPAGVMDIPKEEIVDFLYEKGISNNYNEPMTLEQIKRLKEDDLYTIYENIYVTNNLVNIQQVKGEDLEIVDQDKFTYLLTYSFPCQDLSLAGTRKLMSDTSTRSGMLWEVERILLECKEIGTLPDVLLMENVPQVHGEGAIEDFNKWQLRLEQLGYKNYWQDLIATDYGIPQTRNRTFMVSILGDYNYTFPKPIPLKLKLKDMLEDEVDEKYYLSDKMKQYIFSEDDKYKVNKNSLKLNREIACSKTTREGWTRADTSDYIIDNIGNKSLQETLQKNEIKDTCYIDTYNKRIDEEKSGTITTGVSFRNNTFLADSDLRIRKLTPKECFRLMGVKDEDYDKVAKNQSDSSLYHLAGDSIVVNVLMAIFGEMIDDNKRVNE